MTWCWFLVLFITKSKQAVHLEYLTTQEEPDNLNTFYWIIIQVKLANWQEISIYCVLKCSFI